MVKCRKLHLEEADRIAEIDATHFIRNVWRINKATGEYGLVETNWNVDWEKNDALALLPDRIFCWCVPMAKAGQNRNWCGWIRSDGLIGRKV